jgi:hypothetical protein
MVSIIRPEPDRKRNPKPDKKRNPKTDEAKSRGGKELPPVEKRDKRGQKQYTTDGLKSIKAQSLNTINKTKLAQPSRRGGR